MRKVNIKDITEESWASPKGKFGGASKGISEALGRKPFSTDLKERHPFDVELTRIPPGKTAYPYHTHSAQWEFYYVLSGKGLVRHKDGTMPIEQVMRLFSSRRKGIPSVVTGRKAFFISLLPVIQ